MDYKLSQLVSVIKTVTPSLCVFSMSHVSFDVILVEAAVYLLSGIVLLISDCKMIYCGIFLKTVYALETWVCNFCITHSAFTQLWYHEQLDVSCGNSRLFSWHWWCQCLFKNSLFSGCLFNNSPLVHSIQEPCKAQIDCLPFVVIVSPPCRICKRSLQLLLDWIGLSFCWCKPCEMSPAWKTFLVTLTCVSSHRVFCLSGGLYLIPLIFWSSTFVIIFKSHLYQEICSRHGCPMKS